LYPVRFPSAVTPVIAPISSFSSGVDRKDVPDAFVRFESRVRRNIS